MGTQVSAQFYKSLLGNRHVWSQMTDKVGRLQGVTLHDLWRERSVEPTALRDIVNSKTHHHGIAAKNHIGQSLVSPGALEPNHLRAGSYKGHRIRHVRRIRVEPEFLFDTEERYDANLSGLGPFLAVIRIEIVVCSIGINIDLEVFPVLESRNILVPGIAEPSIPLVNHDGLRGRAKFCCIVRGSADDMRDVPCLGSIVTPWRLDM